MKRLKIREIIGVLLIVVMLLSIISCTKKPAAKNADSSNWSEILTEELNDDPLPDYERPDETGRTWYQIFVYSFRDGNGDGIGDLTGVTASLDYIKNLGFDGIWLSPIHPSTTYHKYDVKDYLSIDPEYGTMEDFDALMKKCDELGLQVLLDLVLNHTSDEHPWFSEHPEYYHIADAPGNGNWKQLSNGKFYECQFWDKMPDLDLSNVALRNEFENIMKYWLDKGVAGFRLDAAKEYESGNKTENIEILKWVNETTKKIKPDAYLVAEDWDTSSGLYEYYQSGIDSFFAFPFALSDGPVAALLLQSPTKISDYLNKVKEAQNAMIEAAPENAKDQVTLAPFFTNHDNPRSAGFMRRDDYLIKSAWGLTLTMPGDAFVYYGEELGMSGSGKDENKRAPMYWFEDESAPGMTKGPSGMEKQENTFGSATSQAGDENSILSYLREAVRLRAKYPAIGRGAILNHAVSVSASDMEAVKISELPEDKNGTERSGTYLGEEPATGEVNLESAAGKVGAITKIYDGKAITLIYNMSCAKASVDIEKVLADYTVSSSKPPSKLGDYLSATGMEVRQNGSTLELPPYAIAVVE
ncbi:MAG: alpha-amylase [Lachnospiraceae bacterium]|jgi:glycosidase|nr:alpha-amylase [Lachnospiraceae bacterium]